MFSWIQKWKLQKCVEYSRSKIEITVGSSESCVQFQVQYRTKIIFEIFEEEKSGKQNIRLGCQLLDCKET